MSILVVSSKGRGLDVAMRLKAEGHHTIFRVEDNSQSTVGDGLVAKDRAPLARTLQEHFDYFLIFDYKYGELTQFLQGKGYQVIGDSRFSELLQLDDNYRQMVMRVIGSGDLSQEHPVNGAFTAGWFNGHKFLNAFYEGQIYCHLMNGDVGPLVDCSGSVVKQLKKRPHQFSEDLEKSLAMTGYLGPVIMRMKNLSPFSLSCYFIPGVSQALLELLNCPLGTFFGKLSRGLGFIKPNADWAISVQLSLPPYPDQKRSRASEGVKLQGQVEEQAGKYLWWQDVKRQDNALECAGRAAVLGYATAHGRSLKECRRRVYRTIERLDVKSLQYRTDIGEAG